MTNILCLFFFQSCDRKATKNGDACKTGPRAPPGQERRGGKVKVIAFVNINLNVTEER